MKIKFIYTVLLLQISLMFLSQNINDLSFTNLDAEKFNATAIRRIQNGLDNTMWMITDKGLTNFNGYKSKHYTYIKDSKKGLLSIKTLGLFVDKEGLIWLGYQDVAAISYFNPKTELFTHFEPDSLNSNAFPKDAVLSNFKQDSQGRIWITTWGGGILLLNKEKKSFTHFNIKNTNKQLQSNTVRDFYEIEKNKFIITFFEEKEDGTNLPCFFNSETKIFSPFPFENYFKNLDTELVTSMKHILTICHFFHKDKYNNYWFGTYSGLVCLDNKTMTAKRVSGKKFNTFVGNFEMVSTFIIDDQDRMWTNTGNSGIMVVDLKTQKAFYHKQYLNCANCVADNYITSFTKDKEDNIWVTNTSGKISIYESLSQQFKLKTWENLKLDFSDASGNAMPLNNIQPRNGNLVYLSSKNGISVYNYKKDSLLDVIKFAVDNKNGPNVFRFYNQHLIANSSIIVKDNGIDNIVSYNLKTKKVVREMITPGNYFKINFKNDSIAPIIIGHAYLGYLLKYSFEKNSIDTIYFQNKLNPFLDKYTNNYSEILKNGKWFFDIGDAFITYNPINKKVTRFAYQKPYDKLFPDSIITSYFYNKKNTVWITTNKGIYSYNEQTEEIINWTNQLLIKDFIVQGVVEDTIGNLWYTSVKDLYRYNFKTKQVFKFTKALGLKGDGFNHLNRLHEMYINNGTPFFPTNKGLLFFDPSEIKIKNTKPILSLYDVSINDSLQSNNSVNNFLTGNVELGYSDNNILFEVCTNQLFSPIPNKFRYYLKGRDTKWVDNETSNKFNFQNLPAGKYILKIICVNSYNIESETLTIKFTINKPFWKTWWFIIGSLILIVFSVIRLIKHREKLLQQKSIELENTVFERTKEVVKQKEIIEEKQKELTDSIKYAKRIQNALLASKSLLDTNLNNYFIYFNPKDIVSGDFYWATVFKNKFYFIVADSTGHGVPGAFMSLLNINLLNEAINEKQIIEPAEILNYVRKGLILNLAEDGSEEGGKDGMDCSLLCLDFTTNTLHYACANNEIVIIRNKELIQLKGDRMPVGKSPNENVNFTNHIFQLQKDDIIYSFTDGYADQFGGENGKKIKSKKLKELILKNSNFLLSEQQIYLKSEFEKWKGNLEQVDDVCVIGIKI